MKHFRYWHIFALLIFTAPVPLTDTALASDLELGKAVFMDRERGHCLLCHTIQQTEEQFHGNIGPDLSDVGNRLSADQIRARIVNPRPFNSATIMPAYHKNTELRQVARAYEDKPVLSLEEVTQLVEYVSSLRLTTP